MACKACEDAAATLVRRCFDGRHGEGEQRSIRCFEADAVRSACRHSPSEQNELIAEATELVDSYRDLLALDLKYPSTDVTHLRLIRRRRS